MSVESFKDFVNHIHSLVDKLDKNNLIPIDIYLRSMLGVLYNYSEQTPSYSAFVEILEKSFDANPIEFDDKWLELTKPPFLHCQPNPDDFENSMIDLDTNKIISKFEVVLIILIFEIAEYKRCSEFSESQESDTDNEELNTNSEEEYQLGWASQDIAVYLLAMAEYIDYSQEEICDWLTITDALEYGRTCSFLDEET